MYPKIVIGLSDHTSGHATVVGAVALLVPELLKNISLDDNSRVGPISLL